MTEPTNDDRARWAMEAGKVFGGLTGLRHTESDDLSCIIQDLITDLMHLARKRGMDAEQLLEWGVGNYRIEVEEEEDE